MLGIVISYNRAKCWGWIAPRDTSLPDFFVHYASLTGRKFLRKGDQVEFEPSARNGKPYAANVRVIEDAVTPTTGVQS